MSSPSSPLVVSLSASSSSSDSSSTLSSSASLVAVLLLLRRVSRLPAQAVSSWTSVTHDSLVCTCD